MGPVLATLPFVVLCLLVPTMLFLLLHPSDVADRAGRLAARLRRAPATSTPRPLEAIVSDVHRLGRRFHSPQRSFAKATSLRRAYDEVLAECCAALGVDQLLAVIPPSPELDRERARVEHVLHRWGIDLSDLDQAA